MKIEYAMAIAVLPAFCVLVGLVVGTLRYVKYGPEIRKRVEEDFREKGLKVALMSFIIKDLIKGWLNVPPKSWIKIFLG